MAQEEEGGDPGGEEGSCTRCLKCQGVLGPDNEPTHEGVVDPMSSYGSLVPHLTGGCWYFPDVFRVCPHPLCGEESEDFAVRERTLDELSEAVEHGNGMAVAKLVATQRSLVINHERQAIQLLGCGARIIAHYKLTPETYTVASLHLQNSQARAVAMANNGVMFPRFLFSLLP